MSNATNFFTGKAANVMRVLLVNYPKNLDLRTLAKDAGVSLGWASKVSRALIQERLAIRESERAELKLMDPFSLLRRWANYNNFAFNTKFVDYYSQEEDFSKLFASFKEKSGPEYAFTGLAGALLVAAFVRPTNAHLYVNSETDARAWAKTMGLMPIEKDGNVKFAIVENAGVFYGAKTTDGVKVVSDVQLYVDLLNYPARGQEAAEEVYKIIEKRWKSVEVV